MAMIIACRATEARSAAGVAIFRRRGALAESLIFTLILTRFHPTVESGSEAAQGVFRGDLCDVFEGRTPQFRDSASRVDDVGRLVRSAALRNRCEIRTVGLHEDPVVGC